MLARLRAATNLLKQASHHSRLQMLHRLAKGEMTTGDLCVAVEQGHAAGCQHLTRLRLGGLVTSRRSGLHVLHRLTPPGLAFVKVIERMVD